MKCISHNRNATQRKLLFAAAIAAAGAGMLAEAAKADVIQVNLGTDADGQNFTLTTATSGAPGGDYALWNNETGESASGQPLTMVSGSLSTATLSYTTTNDFYVHNQQNNSNERLLYSWIGENDSTSAATVTVSGLNASGFTNYDVYVYLDSNNVTNASINIGNSTYYFTVEGQSFSVNGSSADFVPITDSTGYGTVAPGDYVEFTGLTGDSFTIDLNNDVANSGMNAGISGFQIVEAPEPSALSLIGLGAAALLGRRRRRDRVVQA